MAKWKVFLLFLTEIILLTGCGIGNQEISASDDNSVSAAAEVDSSTQTIANISEMFTDRDLENGYDEKSSELIELSGNNVLCDSSAVRISGSTVTITDEGTYILSGTLNDGMIVVNADDADKVQLVLNGTNITSSASAAIYVLSADKVFITTVSGTENTLGNGGEYAAIDDNNIDAVIFSKSDLTLNGAGSLAINAAAGHGIVSKDDLVLGGGMYDITAADHGLRGNDSVRIAGGTYTITSGKDGIHAENADDADLGFLYIADGTFHITAEGDGMSAGSYLQIENGEYTIETGGGTEDSVSTKAVKAATELNINGGKFTIDSADDALHSNGNLTIEGGTIEIASGDDGVHADAAVFISGGSINITQSYEGIEGLSIDITGGDIVLAARDDGLNAAGGNDSSGFGGRGEDIFAVTEGVYISISGGRLYVNASGDGIDSNGDLSVSGGETYVSGPSDSGNGAIDYNGEAVISGGIFVAAGASGMAQNFGTSSTQGVMLVMVDSGSAGSAISLSDSNGNELLSWQADKAYSSVIISCPEIVQGSTYTLAADSYTTQITMDSLVYGTAGGKGGGMKGGRGEEIPGAKGMPGAGEIPAGKKMKGGREMRDSENIPEDGETDRDKKMQDDVGLIWTEKSYALG